MRITLQYFDDCPNWNTTDNHLHKLIWDRKLDATVEYQLIGTREDAELHQFRGSPTVLFDGVDPFAERDAPVGLACRIYQTDAGPAGSPTLRQLEQAIDSVREKT